jgi:hypothetical protein
MHHTGRMSSPAVSVFEVRMHWIQVTQANTGVKLYVNMELVILVAPNRKGGANLMLTVREQSPGSGKDSARLIPVVETQSEVMALLSAAKKT